MFTKGSPTEINEPPLANGRGGGGRGEPENEVPHF